LYGLYRRVASVEYALHIIGLAELTNIVTGITLLETFKIKSDSYLNQNDFWEHSYLVGNLSKSLCKHFNAEFSRESFVAGFLHDLGISVTHKYLHASFIKIHDEVINNDKDYGNYENEIIGLNHQEIALTLLDKWNFPLMLCQAVLFHHNPSKMSGDNRLAAIIHLADIIANSIYGNKYFWDRKIEPDIDGLSQLGIRDAQAVEKLVEDYQEEITKNENLPV